MSLRTIVKQSQSPAIAALRYAPLAMTNIQLILSKYLMHGIQFHPCGVMTNYAIQKKWEMK